MESSKRRSLFIFKGLKLWRVKVLKSRVKFYILGQKCSIWGAYAMVTAYIGLLVKITISAFAGSYAGPLSCSNRNLECWFL